MKKINVTICTGSDCNRTQATWLKHFDQLLGPSLRSLVQVCCGDCEHKCTSDLANAPRVKVNDRILPRATPGQVKNAVLEVAQGLAYSTVKP